MVALAVRQEMLSHDRPPVLPRDAESRWEGRLPVMRAFPRLAVERDEAPALEARWDEEPERWDGLA